MSIHPSGPHLRRDVDRFHQLLASAGPVRRFGLLPCGMARSQRMDYRLQINHHQKGYFRRFGFACGMQQQFMIEIFASSASRLLIEVSSPAVVE
jgi:hypothetical protein